MVQAQVDTANDPVAIDRLYFQPLDESAGNLQYVTARPQRHRSRPVRPEAQPQRTTARQAASATNPTNITAPGGTPADITLTAGQTSHHLKMTGFNFAVPSGATIKGIRAYLFNGGHAFGSGYNSAAHLVKAGTVQGPNGALQSGGPNDGFYDAVTFGGPTDLWGGAWTSSDINNSGFGVLF